jgi:hypothetical protein
VNIAPVPVYSYLDIVGNHMYYTLAVDTIVRMGLENWRLLMLHQEVEGRLSQVLKFEDIVDSKRCVGWYLVT